MASLGLFEILLQNIGRLLLLVLLVGGLVIAVQRQSRHPMVSLYVAIAMVAALLRERLRRSAATDASSSREVSSASSTVGRASIRSAATAYSLC